jgi:hypothetical protein
MKYDLIVDVTHPDKTCEKVHFQVWNRFGDMSLVENDVLDEECGSG